MGTNQAIPSTLQQIRSFERSARLFLVATLLDGIVYSAWSLFFNFYILGRGFDRQFLGLVTSASSLSALILGLPLGALSDRLGRKRSMLLGVALYYGATAIVLTAPQPGWILTASFVAGAGHTLYYLSQAPFMMNVSSPTNRTMLFSLNFGLVTLAGAFGSLFAGQLPALFGGWLGVEPRSATAYQAVLLASVLLGSLTLIPLGLIREPRSASQAQSTATSTENPLISTLHVLFQPITIKLALPNLLIGFGAAILIPYMNVFFLDKFAIRDETLGILYSLSALLTGLGTLVGPRLAFGWGSKIRAVVITQGLSVLFLLLVGFVPALWMAGSSFLIRGALMNMSVPLYSAFAMEQVPDRQRGSVNSVKEWAWTIGWAIGPFISGIVQERYGFPPLFIATTLLYAAAILLTWLFFRRSERQGEGSLPAALA